MKSILHKTIQSPTKHKALLFKLANLEGQGHRKLARYKKKHHITDAIFLKHLVDEARHSSFLSTLAKQLGPNEKIDSKTKHYLTRLEVFILRQLKLHKISYTKELPYVLMTYVIEKRAENFYPLYECMLKEAGNSISIQSIIDDELEHLCQMDHELEVIDLPSDLMNDCIQFERTLFNDFLIGLMDYK